MDPTPHAVPDYRLVAIDLDGTLLTPEGQITPTTLHVLEQVHTRGVQIMLCTGRTLHKAQEVVHPIPFEFLLALHNGAMLIEPHTERVLLKQLLPAEQAAQVFTFLNRHEYPSTVYSFGDDGYRLHYQPGDLSIGMDRFLSSKRSILSPCNSLRSVLHTPLIHFVAVDCQKRVLWGLETLRNQLNGVHVLTSGGFYENQYWFLEVLAKQASKSQAIATVAENQGISREQILAIGDNYNDLDMIQYAGTGVAMGNAPKEIQRQADIVTDSNREEGVAKILQRLVLSR